VTVAILSDAPTLTTGFGVTTRRIADALHDAGWEVACFGIKARPGDCADETGYLVWPAERGGHWTDSLAEFFATTKPRLLLLNMDAYNAVECLAAVRSAGYEGPVASYVVFDGLPVGRYYLDAQRSCNAVLASSRTAAAYLRANGIDVAAVAPPGVDRDLFAPSPNPAGLRARAGLRGAAVIGVFGTNTERKQIPRVLHALSEITSRTTGRRVLLYLHCRPVGYWHLTDIADELGIAEHVFFPGSSFDEARGVHAAGTTSRASRIGTIGSFTPDFSYVDRINCCDVIVNVPHSGDIEQVILEAQACGVPLVHTDDNGIMSEAVGSGGMLLRGRDTATGRCGEHIHHVAPADVTNAVVSILQDEQLRSSLRKAGLDNVARYTWAPLRDAARDVVGRFLKP
jgi:glycosyltransferase involved in cell wall biosynthesis